MRASKPHAGISRARSDPGTTRGYRLLEHLVADREHVVPSRHIERPPRREQIRELLRGARNRILGADRHQHRRADRRDLLARQSSGANRECTPRAPSDRTWSARRRCGTCVPSDREHPRATAPRAPRRCSRAVPPHRPGASQGRRIRRGAGVADGRAQRTRRCARPWSSPSHRRGRDRDDRAARARPRPSGRCDRRPDRGACSSAPCPRLSSAMTRRPAPVSVATQPG